MFIYNFFIRLYFDIDSLTDYVRGIVKALKGYELLRVSFDFEALNHSNLYFFKGIA